MVNSLTKTSHQRFKFFTTNHWHFKFFEKSYNISLSQKYISHKEICETINSCDLKICCIDVWKNNKLSTCQWIHRISVCENWKWSIKDFNNCSCYLPTCIECIFHSWPRLASITDSLSITTKHWKLRMGIGENYLYSELDRVTRGVGSTTWVS